MLSGLLTKLMPKITPAVLTASLAVLITALMACGSEAHPTATSAPLAPPPTATAVPPGFVPALSLPSTELLGGGSPQKFIQVFDEGRANSSFRPTGEFAAAAKPLGEGEKLKVGIIFVGSQRDLGWNQAAAAGADYVEQTLPDVEMTPRREYPGDGRSAGGGGADDPGRSYHRHTHQLRIL